MQPLLLCVSTEDELRETRRRVLETRYRVVAVRNLNDLKAQSSGCAFSILVLCHSLSADDRATAARIARERWPAIKVLDIIAFPASRLLGEMDAVVVGLAGPVAMLDAVAALLPGSATAQA